MRSSLNSKTLTERRVKTPSKNVVIGGMNLQEEGEK
jgi:hypothetical protein